MINTPNITSRINTYSSFQQDKSYQSHPISRFKQDEQDTIDINTKGGKNKTSSKIILGVIGTIVLGSIAFIATKNRNNNKTSSKYLDALAQGLSDYTNKKINPNKLKSVIDINEFTDAIKNLKEENYIASPENIENGIFRADLHSHSNFSDGKGTVEDILDNVSKYADKLHSKTNEKFIYALTDHDEVEGVKKALSIIADNPKKYQNVLFVPGAEISYALPSKNKDNCWGTAEFLVHCINPFSENVNKFCQNIQMKRKNMHKNFLLDAKEIFPGVNFSIKEAQKANFPLELTRMNTQWNMFHYVETKRGITQIAKEQDRNPEKMYAEVMGKLNEKDDKFLYTLYEKGLIDRELKENNHLKEAICVGKYSPKVVNNKVTSTPAENTFDEFINTFSKEEDLFVSFAHPVCISEHIKKTNGKYDIEGLNNFLSKLVNDSKGLIKGTEAYHQAYKPEYQNNSKEVNAFLQNKNLLNLGGRDSHEYNWMSL